jgi:5'-nucleotidase
MIRKQRCQILLTNDDGIQSPGLWAAAEALSSLGYVTIAAPRDQASSTGRSMLRTSDGKIHPSSLHIGDQVWSVYAVGGTPAQTVQHAVLEIMPAKPDLVVSGINYGENLGNDITASGTVGAAMEAAGMGIRSLAVSLQLVNVEADYLSYSKEVDFTTAAHFTRVIARQMLEQPLPDDVDMINLVVPAKATPATPLRVTRLSKERYFNPVAVRAGSLQDKGAIGAEIIKPEDLIGRDTDIYALLVDEVVSATPLSLDMTSRVNLRGLEDQFKAGQQEDDAGL